MTVEEARGALREVLDYFGEPDLDLPTHGWKRLRCPFHDDRTPSASVSSTKFKCHACDVRGDAIDLVMMELNMTFKEALEFIQELTSG